jgi:predicted nucleotide-binding protein (sugar kinase/HSP70/actin superfamily)
MGYTLENLPHADKEAAEIGLKYANNEICYPATLVVGSIIKGLQSGKYNFDEIAIGITQTGGQCRASNYIALIKNALIAAGYDTIPVISVAFGNDMMNEQPALNSNSPEIFPLHSFHCYIRIVFPNYIMPLWCAKNTKGIAKKLRVKYIDLALPYIKKRSTKGLLRLFEQAINEFDAT